MGDFIAYVEGKEKEKERIVEDSES